MVRSIDCRARSSVDFAHAGARRILFPLTAIATGYLAIVFVSYVLELRRDIPAPTPAVDWLWLTEAVLLAAFSRCNGKAGGRPAADAISTRSLHCWCDTRLSHRRVEYRTSADLLHDPSGRLLIRSRTASLSMPPASSIQCLMMRPLQHA